MPISMSVNANYVKPSIFTSARRLGPLTDRIIERYMRKGYYGDEYKDHKKPKPYRAKLELPLSVRQKANNAVKNLLK